MNPTTDDFAPDAPPLRAVRKVPVGRPRKAEPRTEQCNVSLTKREKAVVQHRAAMRGQTEAEFARSVLLAGTPYARAPVAEPTRSLSERLLDDELRHMGVNLNQIARRINTHPDRPLPDDLQPLLALIRRHLQAVLPHGA